MKNTTHSNAHTNADSNAPPPRGFVVLVVLLILAVISVVAVGQFASVTHESVVGVRKEEEAQARALAEGCLTELQRNAECFLDATDLGTPCGSTGNTFGPGYSQPDFDRLLNPDDSAAANGDEFVPSFASKTVKVPNTASGQRWGLVARNGGACLVRFEDNSDDDFPAGAVSDDGATHACGGGLEGNGPDVAFCDRDKAIYLTAIGLFPVDPTAAGTQAVADAAYAKAHSRVTLRKLFAAEVPTSFPAGIVSSGTVNFKNNALLCGAGGITANDLDGQFKGSSCLCGPVQTTSTSNGNPPVGSGCPCPPPVTTCNPGSAVTGVTTPKKIDIDGNFNKCAGGVQAGCEPGSVANGIYTSPLQPMGPVAKIPLIGTVGGNFRANNGFGNPYAGTNAPGAPGLNDLATNKGDVNIVTSGVAPDICEFYFDSDGANSIYYFDAYDTDTSATIASYGMTVTALATEDCTTYAKDPVDKPCTWVGSTMTCVAGQSACWKLLARLDGATAANIGGTQVESTAFVGLEQLRMNTATPAPFVNTTGHNLFSGTTAASNLCGAPNNDTKLRSCKNCNGSSGTITAAGAGDWTFTDTNNNNMPVPFIAVVDGHPVLRDLGNGASPNLPLHATFLVSSNGGGTNVDDTASNRFGLCCAECDCTGVGGLTINVASACKRGDGVTPIYPVVGTSPPGAPPVPGFAIKTDASMNLDIDGLLAGVTWVGGSSTVSGNSCVAGRYAVGGDLIINSGSLVTSVFVDDALVVGDVDAGNNQTFKGTLWVEGNVDVKNNFTLIGRIVSDGNVTFKNDAKILWDGGGNSGSFGNQALSSFMESQW